MTTRPAGVSILKLPAQGKNQECAVCDSDMFWMTEIEVKTYVEENGMTGQPDGPAIISHLQSHEGMPEWLRRADPGDATEEPGGIIVIDGPRACHHEGTITPESWITGQGTNVYVDGSPLNPERSQAVWNHSPSGFAWGYGGSGPAQLGLALLLEAGASDDEASRHHQEFKWEVIRRLPSQESFMLQGVTVTEWLKRKRENRD